MITLQHEYNNMGRSIYISVLPALIQQVAIAEKETHMEVQTDIADAMKCPIDVGGMYDLYHTLTHSETVWVKIFILRGRAVLRDYCQHLYEIRFKQQSGIVVHRWLQQSMNQV